MPLLATQSTPTGTTLAFAKSPFTGKVNTMELPMSEEQFNAAFDAWNRGVLIQNAFPMLSADQREFIKTGIYGAEWDTFLGTDDE